MAITRTGTNGPDLLVGSAEDDLLLGLAGDDRLEGLGGGDLLDGGMGNDLMLGGAGNDTYYVNKETDQVVELPGQGYDTVRSTVSWTLGTGQEALVMATLSAVAGTGNALDNSIIGSLADNLLRGLEGDDRLEGRDGDDALQGGEGDDWLDGGSGQDVLHGGLGDDTYVVDSAADRTVELRNEGYDTIRSSVAWTLGDHVEKLVLTGSAATGTGNALDNTVIGNAAGNALKGAAGDDRLEGGVGDDLLDGGMGNDLMLGGAGNDRYIVNKVTDRAFEFADQGIDEVIATVSFALGSNVENLRLVGGNALTGSGNGLDNLLTGSAAGNTLYGRDGDDSLSGMEGDDRLEGGAGDDLLDGGAGDDLLLGGSGNDRYVVLPGDRIIELADGGYDTVVTRGSWTLGANLEALLLVGTSRATGIGNGLANLIVGSSLSDTLQGLGGDDLLQGGAGHDTLEGGAGNDRLEGGTGNDTLDGGMGDDTLLGGLGDDTYSVNKVTDQVAEQVGEGYDTVRSTVSWTLGTGQEALVMATLSAVSGTGNALDNSIIGSAAGNRLDGLEGDDQLEGRDGDDRLEGGLGDDTLIGGRGNDTLLGGAGNDRLEGGDGDDILEAGAGDDVLEGGGGNDTYRIGLDSGTVTINDAWGTDTVESWRSMTIWLERLVLMGEADLDGTSRFVQGNAGNNRLEGYTLAGGAGNDTYVGLAWQEQERIEGRGGEYRLITHLPWIIEAAGEGVDTLIWQYGNFFDGVTYNSSLTLVQWTLWDNVENLVLLEEQWGLSGNALDNQITGSEGNDIVHGGAGHDTMLGGLGDDSLYGDAGDDLLLGGDGNDALFGGDGSLYGDGGDDRVEGGAGDDDLNAHVMVGGTGNDTYFYTASTQRIVELEGEGHDIVWARADVDLRELGGSIEELILEETGITGTGSLGDDLIRVMSWDVTAYGLDGDDRFVTEVEATLQGGAGNDVYVLQDHSVVVELADAGHDTVEFRYAAGRVSLADNVEDGFILTAGSNHLIGNAGNNVLTAIGSGSADLSGLAGDDVLIAAAGGTLRGGEGHDRLVGGALLLGEEGDDILEADAATTRLDGGSGDDILHGETRGSAVPSIVFVIDSAGDRITGDRVGDLVEGSGVIDLTGLAVLELRLLAAATGLGNAADNILIGSSGDDILEGRAGDDRLQGGLEADRLTGGAGNDLFHYASALEGGDVVTDFASGEDRLLISATGFGGGLVAGMSLAATGRFTANTTGEAEEGVGRGQFMLNTTDNSLYWDADGLGGIGTVRLARFETLANGLAAADIVIA
ncbi:hypothetical protein BKE38_18430 [Pseudoroseomonas deserti]|uniref:Haemolysin-type calcium binding-related domain-containing protein n=1 Tax=Teichococcus deserti TaxID=1817963 RepID=A0A1V2GYW9_9PROT|nr:hypothetical protein [Pseudoroseomonas deserti]ONG50400.1 hypothetical protein BKE38_18430 [Pseudoroseomonas deserti]